MLKQTMLQANCIRDQFTALTERTYQKFPQNRWPNMLMDNLIIINFLLKQNHKFKEAFGLGNQRRSSNSTDLTTQLLIVHQKETSIRCVIHREQQQQ